MIEYTIRAALESEYIDVIFLSTEDHEIANFGLGLGLDVSYRRPKELAQDDTSMMDTLEHGLFWFAEKTGAMPDEVILLQPTSPLRSSQDVDNAVRQFRQERCSSLVSVHQMREHPCECVVKENDRRWHYLSAPPKAVVRRQDYENRYFFVNGAIYIASAETLLNRRSFLIPNATALFEMPRLRGLDIDTPLDLSFAEAILNGSHLH